MAIDRDSQEYASLTKLQRKQLEACGRINGKSRPRPRAKPLASFGIPAPILEPVGTILARFVVPGRVVPWQTHGRPHPALRKWQRTVKKAAMTGYHSGQSPYQGTVKLEITIYLCSSIKKHPDLTNCVKAIEDAMQDVVFMNDRQVRCHISCLDFSNIARHEQEVEVEVLSCGDRNP